MIGKPRERIGTKTARAVDPFVELFNEKTASANPRNRLPESPKNILAGTKL
jgi:hypothetical protein